MRICRLRLRLIYYLYIPISGEGKCMHLQQQHRAFHNQELEHNAAMQLLGHVLLIKTANK